MSPFEPLCAVGREMDLLLGREPRCCCEAVHTYVDSVLYDLAMPANSGDDKLEVLRQCPLMEGASEAGLRALSPGVRVMRVQRRDELFPRGEDGSHL
jgi:hypothetical protein